MTLLTIVSLVTSAVVLVSIVVSIWAMCLNRKTDEILDDVERRIDSITGRRRS